MSQPGVEIRVTEHSKFGQFIILWSYKIQFYKVCDLYLKNCQYSDKNVNITMVIRGSDTYEPFRQ